MDFSKLYGNINSVLSGADLLTSLINSVALVSPQEDKGLNGWLFHIPKDNNLSFESDITDHYVENNTAVQDHIALKPEEYSVSGLIGELNYRDVYDKTQTDMREAQSKFPMIGIIAPKLTQQAMQAMNTVERAYSVAEKVYGLTGQDNTPDVYKQFLEETEGKFSDSKHKQQQLAVNYFYWAWKSRKLFKVQTPWRIFDNMVIKSCRVTQNEETDTVTDITLNFKKINVIDYVIEEQESKMGRQAVQAQTKINKGTSKTEAKQGLLLKGLFATNRGLNG